jgi:hypothetical protein
MVLLLGISDQVLGVAAEDPAGRLSWALLAASVKRPCSGDAACGAASRRFDWKSYRKVTD